MYAVQHVQHICICASLDSSGSHPNCEPRFVGVRPFFSRPVVSLVWQGEVFVQSLATRTTLVGFPEYCD